MTSNFAKRLQIEALKATIANLKKDFDGLQLDLEGAGDADEKNRLQSKLNRKLDEIDKAEQELKILKQALKKANIDELINILNPYYYQIENDILDAYYNSLPNRLIDRDNKPQDVEAIITGLFLPQPPNTYSYIDQFVGYLLLCLNQTQDIDIKQKLNVWAEENIVECQRLIMQLKAELKQKKEQQNGYAGLFIVISDREGSYAVEAWLIKNINQNLDGDEQYLASDCEQMQFDGKVEIFSDKQLSNLPQLVAHWLDKCNISIKQIHIFLPYKLMNHQVDWWKSNNDEDDEEKIGEMYEVLIRCSERFRGRNQRVERWKEKGRQIKQKLAEPATNVFICCDCETDRKLEANCKRDNVIAVQITNIFQQEQPGSVLWKSSVPLAVWIRTPLSEYENKLVLDELIKDIPVQQLPREVKSKRLEASGYEPPENHIGRHLCLLWDDPTLLPPEQTVTEVYL